MREFSRIFSPHSACVDVCNLAPHPAPSGIKNCAALRCLFPLVKILVPYLMFTLKCDIIHGKFKYFANCFV